MTKLKATKMLHEPNDLELEDDAQQLTKPQRNISMLFGVCFE